MKSRLVLSAVLLTLATVALAQSEPHKMDAPKPDAPPVMRNTLFLICMKTPLWAAGTMTKFKHITEYS